MVGKGTSLVGSQEKTGLERRKVAGDRLPEEKAKCSYLQVSVLRRST